MNGIGMPFFLAAPGSALTSSGANPVIVILMFVLRCLVPLLLMLGVSYLLRRLGLISESPPPSTTGPAPGAKEGAHNDDRG